MIDYVYVMIQGSGNLLRTCCRNSSSSWQRVGWEPKYYVAALPCHQLSHCVYCRKVVGGFRCLQVAQLCHSRLFKLPTTFGPIESIYGTEIYTKLE